MEKINKVLEVFRVPSRREEWVQKWRVTEPNLEGSEGKSSYGHQIYSVTGSRQRQETFEKCSKMCKTEGGKMCRYTVRLGRRENRENARNKRKVVEGETGRVLPCRHTILFPPRMNPLLGCGQGGWPSWLSSTACQQGHALPWRSLAHDGAEQEYGSLALSAQGWSPLAGSPASGFLLAWPALCQICFADHIHLVTLSPSLMLSLDFWPC